MRTFLRYLAASVLLMSAVVVRGDEPTKGRTDGEPGTGEHCCGMKGLGGATVTVLCHPDEVALGQEFTVNVAYTTDIKRPVDVHVDLLNAQNKQFYVGKWAQMETMTGGVSLTMRMPEQATEPFLWKVFVTPRGEPFPNMLAETGFVAHIGPQLKSTCQPFANYGSDPAQKPNVDYVKLLTVPPEVAPGQTFTVSVQYNLVNAPAASISAALMRKGPNMLIQSGGVAAQPGDHTVEIPITVPADVQKEPIYVVATLTPAGKAWEDRLAEDRSYAVKYAGTRLLRN